MPDFRRKISAALGTTLLAMAVVAPANAARQVVPPIKVRAVTAKALDRNGDNTLVLRSLRVDRSRGVFVRVSPCHCYRVPGPLKRVRRSTVIRWDHLNWLLPAGRAIQITATRRGRVTRYVRLISRGPVRGLRFQSAGCLDGKRRSMRCPKGTKPVTVGAPVPADSRPLPKVLPLIPPPSLEGPSGFVASSSASVTFEHFAGALRYECSVDGGTYGPCASPVTLSGLADGTHRLSVRGINLDGQPGAEATRSWSVDTTPPTVTITGAPGGVTARRDVTVTFRSSEPGTQECRLDGGSWTQCTGGTVSYAGLATTLPHAVEVRARDALGLVSTPAAVSFHVVETWDDCEKMLGEGEQLVRVPEQGRQVAYNPRVAAVDQLAVRLALSEGREFVAGLEIRDPDGRRILDSQEKRITQADLDAESGWVRFTLRGMNVEPNVGLLVTLRSLTPGVGFEWYRTLYPHSAQGGCLQGWFGPTD